MDKGPSIKAKIFCVILVLAATAVFVAAGFWQLGIYQKYKACTSEVTGTVVRESFGKIYSDDAAEKKLVSSDQWIQIEVEADGSFGLEKIYTNRGKQKVGDKIVIYYDPNEPDNYCVGDPADSHKTNAVIIFALSGILPLFLIFVLIKSGRYYKALNRRRNRYIYFDTPYCRFSFAEGEETGYEGEVEWSPDPAGAKTCTVFFETDTSRAPREGYYALTEKSLLGRQQVDHDIVKLVREIPQLNDIKPGKCYERLNALLSDKSGCDREIRTAAADFFLFRPELNRDNLTEQELLDGIELSYICVRRNGDTEFEIYAPDIYADDLRVVKKADGSKQIHYRTADQNGTDEYWKKL